MCDDGIVYFFDTVTWLVSANDARTLNEIDEPVDISPVRSADVFTTRALMPVGDGDEVATKCWHLT